MAKQKNADVEARLKTVSAFDKVSKSILSLIDNNYSEVDVLSKKDLKFQKIINRELDISKGVSGGSIVDFVASVNMNQTNNPNMGSTPEVDSTSLFTKDIGDIFGYFQDVYKNRFMEITDLKFISKFIPALGEAVKITLDSMISSDNVANTVCRTIDLPSAISKEDRSNIMDIIEGIEKEHDLLKKLKNIVYKKTLVTGSFYIYAVGYKDIFGEYQRIKDSGSIDAVGGVSTRPNIAAHLKSSNSSGFNLVDKNKATESNATMLSAVSSALESMFSASEDRKEIKDVIKKLDDVIPNIETCASPYLSVALESLGELENYDKTFGNIEVVKNNNDLTADTGTYDATKNNIKKYTKKFEHHSGTYIKYIDSKNIIPIKIFDEVVGYYHIHAISKNKKSPNGVNGMLSMQGSLFSATNLTEQKKENAINNIINTISEGILTQFSPAFVNKNSEYKKMIADCIIANGLVDNDYRIQFIPADQIIEFKINEDENGVGESILADSLFPAKLLLSLIICKMLNYMNKSGNKTFAHVYKGPIDVNSNNQLQRVTRMLQESNITFNDLLSTNMVFSKFTRDSNVQLPRAKNGEKLVELETLEGQDINLNTEFEDKLEKMAILGTGVPTVMMDYIDQADFARQIDSANIRYAGRTASLQGDVETPTTKLYRTLVANSNMDESLKTQCINSLEFKLPRPKVLVNANNADFLQNLMSLAENIAAVKIGQSQNTEESGLLKDELMKEFIVKNSPFIDWDEVDIMFERAKISATKLKEKQEDGSGGF